MSSYKSVLKNVSLLGGAKVISLALSIIRNKFTALWLGADGMGVMGMFNAIISPATTIADMGVSTSSVRNIASSENDQETARQVSAVKMFYLVVKFFDNLCDDPFGRIFKKKNAGRIIGDMDYICIGFCCSFFCVGEFF